MVNPGTSKPGITKTPAKASSSAITKAQRDGVNKTLATKQGMSKASASKTASALANVAKAQKDGIKRTEGNRSSKGTNYKRGDWSNKTIKPTTPEVRAESAKFMANQQKAYAKADASGKKGSAWIEEFKKAGGVQPIDVPDSDFNYRATHGKYKNE